MLQIQVDRFGPPSVVAKCVKVPTVENPASWEVIVKVDAFPINPADLAMLSGSYGILPKLPGGIGMEGAGTVVECGDSVTDLRAGDRVMIVANDNWAQFRKVPANLLHKVPNSVDPLVIATTKVNAATAYLLLTHYSKLKKGNWIVQNAPLSNVGRMIIQFAKGLGIRTVNLVRRESAISEVLEIGGDIAVESDENLPQNIQEKLGRAKIRLAFDAVGGTSTEMLASCCADKAKIITYGMLAGEPCHLRPERMVFQQMEHLGFWLSKLLNRFTHEERCQLYNDVVELMQAQDVHPKVDACFSMDRIGDAIRMAEQGKGKAVVFPNGVPEGSPRAADLAARAAQEPQPS